MSESEHEPQSEQASEQHGSGDGPTPGIDDDQLPEDLVPSEDNPLAEGLGDDETVDDLLTGGKTADESDAEASGSEGSGSEAADGTSDGSQPD